MSRIGKKPLEIPSGVEVRVENGILSAKGPKGSMNMDIHPRAIVTITENELNVTVKDPENVKDRAIWGLTRRLAENVVVGAHTGFEKKLEVNGVGFKVSLVGKALKLDVGFSHDVDFMPPEGVTLSVEKNIITVSGIDKQLVGETAARIRRIRKPEPYKGKGIKYLDETIVRKAGKAAKAGSA